MKEKFSVWLMPEETYFKRLQNKISELSQAHNSPVLNPHITVFTGYIEDKNNLPSIIGEVADRFNPVTLKVKGVGARERYIQSLFYYFNLTQELSDLSDAIKKIADPNSEYSLVDLEQTNLEKPFPSFPHLSLLYSDRPLEEKQALIPGVFVPEEEIIFDRIVTMMLPAPANQLEQWYVISDDRLRSSIYASLRI